MILGRLLRVAFFLSVFAIVLSSCGKFTKLQKSTDVGEKYDGAIEYYNKKDYYRASALLDDIIPLLKGTEKFEKAQLYNAYCQYYLQDLESAAFGFKNFVETFPRSQFAEEAYYMYCLSLYEFTPAFSLDQSNTLTAIEGIQNFIRQYPDNEKKEQCNNMIDNLRAKLERKAFENAKLYCKKENYKAALIALENFRKDFPDSQFNEEANFLRVETQYNFANNSIPSKQLMRYGELIEIYQNFIDRYPSSKFAKVAESYFSYAQEKLEEARVAKNAQSENNN